MTGLVVVKRTRWTRSVDEEMVSPCELHTRNPFSSLQTRKPHVEVIRDGDLIVPVTLKNQERLRDGPSGGDFVVALEAQVVGRPDPAVEDG